MSDMGAGNIHWRGSVNEILKFEWDEENNQINQRKHGISFETAAYVFGKLYRNV